MSSSILLYVQSTYIELMSNNLPKVYVFKQQQIHKQNIKYYCTNLTLSVLPHCSQHANHDVFAT